MKIRTEKEKTQSERPQSPSELTVEQLKQIVGGGEASKPSRPL
jgi:hypothetical protein